MAKLKDFFNLTKFQTTTGFLLQKTLEKCLIMNFHETKKL